MKKNKRIFYDFILLTLFITIVLIFSYENNNYQSKSIVSSNIDKIQFNKSEDSIADIVGNDISPDVDLNYYRDYYHNDDIIARLEIPNQLNIFITRANDNDYYLRRSIDKKSSNVGTEFMDYRTDPSSKQINIYGHNSQRLDIPFHKIQSYIDEDFYKENPYIILQDDEGKSLYQVFSIKKVITDYEHMNIEFSDDEWVNHLERLKQNSIHQTDVTFDENSKILVLQTCTNQDDNSYYILSAIQIQRSEKNEYEEKDFVDNI